MNILTDRLPNCVSVDGKSYPVNVGFKNWVKAQHIASLQSGSQTDILKALFLCYKKRLPPSMSLACQGIADFYAGAFKIDENAKIDAKNSQKPARRTRIFDFYHDSRYIYSDFLSFYGIDLTRENIHFYKFCALFEGLSDSCKMTGIMKIRATDLSEIKDSRLKRKYAALKKIYSLNRYMPEHVKKREFGDALGLFF